jgi:hypothetical protein
MPDIENIWCTVPAEYANPDILNKYGVIDRIKTVGEGSAFKKIIPWSIGCSTPARKY